MLVKVCGMRESENIKEVADLAPDLMGFIFYADSPRFVEPDKGWIPPATRIPGVGVFVNAEVDYVVRMAGKFELEFVQLHGNEDVAWIESLLNRINIKVIKVFGIGDHMPIASLRPYEPVVDYFLFDTKSRQHGGTGHHFDWSVLEDYSLNVPFFLSGGIGLDDVPTIKSLRHSSLTGIDVNSRFECSPGLKDVEKLKELMRLWGR